MVVEGDQVDHGLAAEQRFGAPVDRDVAEEPVLNFVPLAGAGRVVHDRVKVEVQALLAAQPGVAQPGLQRLKERELLGAGGAI